VTIPNFRLTIASSLCLSPPSAMPLSSIQKRIAKQQMEWILPADLPTWKDTGYDKREEYRANLIARLNETDNSTIAEVLSKEIQLAHQLLQQKVKSLRRKQGKPRLLVLVGSR
jgi:hypothetical protein